MADREIYGLIMAGMGLICALMNYGTYMLSWRDSEICATMNRSPYWYYPILNHTTWMYGVFGFAFSGYLLSFVFWSETAFGWIGKCVGNG